MQVRDSNISMHSDLESGDDSDVIVNLHIKLSSKKYKKHYEFFWCSKLAPGIHYINNRALKNVMKKIANQDEDDNNDYQFRGGWFFTKKIHERAEEK